MVAKAATDEFGGNIIWSIEVWPGLWDIFRIPDNS